VSAPIATGPREGPGEADGRGPRPGRCHEGQTYPHPHLSGVRAQTGKARDGAARSDGRGHGRSRPNRKTSGARRIPLSSAHLLGDRHTPGRAIGTPPPRRHRSRKQAGPPGVRPRDGGK
jgi:hypothetical protein